MVITADQAKGLIRKMISIINAYGDLDLQSMITEAVIQRNLNIQPRLITRQRQGHLNLKTCVQPMLIAGGQIARRSHDTGQQHTVCQM
ncbi:hypothetical protein D3C73_1215210 [compost metagenome]